MPGLRQSDARHGAPFGWRCPADAQPAREFLGADVPSGAVAVDAVTVAGLTNVLPFGPAITASCTALPWRSCGQVTNHSVQPLSHLPPLGLPLTVTRSPGTAILY